MEVGTTALPHQGVVCASHGPIAGHCIYLPRRHLRKALCSELIIHIPQDEIWLCDCNSPLYPGLCRPFWCPSGDRGTHALSEAKPSRGLPLSPATTIICFIAGGVVVVILTRSCLAQCRSPVSAVLTCFGRLDEGFRHLLPPVYHHRPSRLHTSRREGFLAPV